MATKKEVSEVKESVKDINYFKLLNNIDVSKHVEKKNGLSYLSWAFAWGELKKIHPTANYKVYEKEDGRIYFDDGLTAWVKTSVTVDGLEHIEYLPIMDFKNKSIPIKFITSFDVNKSIQRSLTKAIARHGLGLYIYAGEDLPEEEAKEVKPKKAIPTPTNLEPEAITDEQRNLIVDLILRKGSDTQSILAFYKVKNFTEMNYINADKLIKILEAKPDIEIKDEELPE